MSEIINTLPYDISRCKGFKDNTLCQQCRRTSDGSKYIQSYLVVEKEPKQNCELQIKK